MVPRASGVFPAGELPPITFVCVGIGACRRGTCAREVMESFRERRWCVDDGFDFFSRRKSSHVGVLVSLLEGGADTEQEDREDLTALHWAARLGQETVLVVLLEHHAFIEVRVMGMVDHNRISRGDAFSRKIWLWISNAYRSS